jgi:hypothetical protein
MSVFLLILGVVIAAAGIVLVAAGVPIQGHDFDASVMTPGAVAIVGGLILVGLGLAVRALGRIEQALAARPASRSSRPDDPAAEPDSVSPRLALPPLPASEAEPQPAPPDAATVSRAAAVDAAANSQRDKFPSLVRLDSTMVVEEAEAAALPLPPVRADEDVRELSQAAGAKQAVGATPAKTVMRLERSARSGGRPERTRNFEAFWPKRERPGQDGQGSRQGPQQVPQTPTPAAAEPIAVTPPALDSEPAEGAAQAPMPVSILKTGAVDGMAYTLYSDGSIEAQLPQGMLRFGSIADLRSHIEQSA